MKQIENDGKVVTFSTLGKMYQASDQKTLKGGHSLGEAISLARNMNLELPANIKGLVIVRFRPGKAMIAIGSRVKPHTKAQIRKIGTTEWVTYVDRDGEVFALNQSHQIIRT